MCIAEISEIAEYTKVVQNVVVSICALSTAIIALVGYNKWRKEIKGKSEYEKAKEILKAVYKVKRGFAIIRNPVMYEYEYPEELRGQPGFLRGEEKYQAIAHAYENRWKHLDEAFRELEDLNLDAIVEWGDRYADVIVPLRKCKAELLVCVQDHIRSEKDPDREITTQEERAEKRSILYGLGPDSKHDSFTPQIDDAIAKFEDKLRKHIDK